MPQSSPKTVNTVVRNHSDVLQITTFLLMNTSSSRRAKYNNHDLYRFALSYCRNFSHSFRRNTRSRQWRQHQKTTLRIRMDSLDSNRGQEETSHCLTIAMSRQYTHAFIVSPQLHYGFSVYYSYEFEQRMYLNMHLCFEVLHRILPGTPVRVDSPSDKDSQPSKLQTNNMWKTQFVLQFVVQRMTKIGVLSRR